MGKKLFIFDCFGVVISDVSTLFMDKHLNAEEQLYMRKVFRKVDVGSLDMEQMFAELSALCKMRNEDVKREWASCEALLADTIEVIKGLREQ